MSRILIYGNSGSGKTYLSNLIGNKVGVSPISLDNLFWLPGGYNHKRSEENLSSLVESIKNKQEWIVEGVFGSLVEQFLSQATLLIYLDLPWVVCHKNLLSRGSESSKQLEPAQAEINFEKLLVWAECYYSRDTENSCSYHRSLFESAQCKKVIIKDRSSFDVFLQNRRLELGG